MFSTPSPPIKVINATPELPQHHGLWVVLQAFIQPVACEYYYLTSHKAIVPESNSSIINLVCNPESLLTDAQNANSIPSQGFP